MIVSKNALEKLRIFIQVRHLSLRKHWCSDNCQSYSDYINIIASIKKLTNLFCTLCQQYRSTTGRRFMTFFHTFVQISLIATNIISIATYKTVNRAHVHVYSYSVTGDNIYVEKVSKVN